jgi:hypothetical protein
MLVAKNAFHCLRLSNYFLRPTERSIQTLLLLSRVLQNDLQPEAAWALLGTAIRLAASIGIDVAQPARLGESRSPRIR